MKLGEVAYDYSDAETELKLMKYTNGFWMRDRRIVEVIMIPAQMGGLAPENLRKTMPDVGVKGIGSALQAL